LIKKLAHNKTDSFFYRIHEDIASLEAQDGAKFTVFASGDVHATINGVEYNNESRFGADNFDDLTDKDVNSEDTNFRNNNWFEVIGSKDGKHIEGSGDGDVAFDYDGGIQLLKDVVNQYEKGDSN
jgi:hypothetical protein